MRDTASEAAPAIVWPGDHEPVAGSSMPMRTTSLSLSGSPPEAQSTCAYHDRWQGAIRSASNMASKGALEALESYQGKQDDSPRPTKGAASIIHWKGTKMKGLGKHEGQIELEDGFFTITNNLLTGGHFIANMNSIEVTDIPAHEPVPRGRFNDHMKSEDFFDTATYPVSKFEITGIQYKTTNSLIISGNLTLKDITRNISFAANYKEKTFETGFTIDRFQWNIGYEGSWVDKTLVDKDIVLEIQLFTE